MNRFEILKEVAPYPQIKEIRPKHFVLGMKSWYGENIAHNVVLIDIDEETYKNLGKNTKDHLAYIEIHNDKNFNLYGFTAESIISISTFWTFDTLKEMYRVTFSGYRRLIGGQI